MLNTFVLTLAVVATGATHLFASQRSAGTARISLVGDGVAVSGEYPTVLCGGPFMLGDGVSYQVKAGDWQITVASENRASGKIPLDVKGAVNVVATANGPGGRSFVRRPRDGGSLVIAPDFKTAEATLELRNVVGKETAKLAATFTCK